MACTVLAGCPSDDTTDNADEVGSTATETATDTADTATESSSSSSTTSDTTDTTTTDTATTDPTTTDNTDLPPPICGDGNMDDGEECDDGNGVDTDECTNACTIAICGDTILHEGVEGCDDGNMDNGDGCDSMCMIETCGDGVVDPMEECDDANDIDTDECTNMCTNAVCGDTIIQEGVEECDDGNDVDTDECTNSCAAAICGDSIVQAGVEQCDDGNADPGDGCDGMCQLEARYVFVTSTLQTGNMGGLAGADAICQNLAQAANLPGTYMAWLSTSQPNSTPATRFTQSALPYQTVTGIKVADNWADLIDGSLDAAINVTELGAAPPAGTATCVANVSVWTNTTANGSIFNANNSCGDWTSTNGGSLWGYNNSVTNTWTIACQGGSCGWMEPIYCFQQ